MPYIPNYLHLRKNNVFYFRLRVPKELGLYTAKREVKFSLGVSSKKQALFFSVKAHHILQDTFISLKAKGLEMVKQKIDFKLIQSLITKDLEHKVKLIRAFISEHGPLDSKDFKILNECITALFEHSMSEDSTDKLSDYDLSQTNFFILDEFCSKHNIDKNHLTQQQSKMIVNALYQANKAVNTEWKSETMRANMKLRGVITDSSKNENVTQAQEKGVEKGKIILISDLVEKYIAENKRNWKPKTLEDNASYYRVLIDIIGDIDCKLLDQETANKYKEVVQRLPPNIKQTKKYAGMSIDEILDTNPDKVLTIIAV